MNKLKIAIADNCGGKFSTDIKNHWEKKGHEVRYERGASEHLAQWADIYYVDFWDNNIHYLHKLYNGDPDKNRPEGWDNNKKPRVVVRAVDWEVWIGFVRDQSMIDWVDNIIVIAPHIEEELRKHAEFGNKITLIRPGVNLEKFTPKVSVTDGFQLGMVLGDMWFPKQHMMGLDIFHQLWQKDKRWKFHIRGQHEGGNDFWKKMFDYYVESRGMQDAVTLYLQTDDMNAWYEHIDILLHPGMKEAFCYAVGEAMAKDIQVVCNDFYGSRDIWPGDILYLDSQEAIKKITNKDPLNTREYIERNYSLKEMTDAYDHLLGT
jgi:hypothetical protein